jgi:hypothetical protein
MFILYRWKSDEAGFDSHMVKPIEPTALEEQLANLPEAIYSL